MRGGRSDDRRRHALLAGVVDEHPATLVVADEVHVHRPQQPTAHNPHTVGELLRRAGGKAPWSRPGADGSRPCGGQSRHDVPRVSPPHSSGATSLSVSENVQRWPARSSRVVLPLPVLVLRRLREDARTVRPRALAVGPGVVDTNHDRVAFLALASWAPVMTDIADDDGAVAEAELRAVVLADPDALDEAERGGEPRHRLAHVRIDEDGDDRCRRDRTIALQADAEATSPADERHEKPRAPHRAVDRQPDAQRRTRIRLRRCVRPGGRRRGRPPGPGSGSGGPRAPVVARSRSTAVIVGVDVFSTRDLARSSSQAAGPQDAVVARPRPRSRSRRRGCPRPTAAATRSAAGPPRSARGGRRAAAPCRPSPSRRTDASTRT